MVKISAKSLKEEIDRFRLLLFHPRERCRTNFARQQKDGTYRPGRGKLTDTLLLAHLKRKLTLGAYQLDSDDRIKWMAFDIDQTKPNENNPIFASRKQLKELVVDLHRAASRQGRRAYVATSGWKGIHIYLFFNSLIQAARARFLGEQILQEVKPPTGITIELFPKQTRKGNGLGSLLKCPFSVHRVTKNRTRFLDKNFTKLNLTPSDIVRNPPERIPNERVKLTSRSREIDLHIKEDLPPLFRKLLREDSRIRDLFEGRGKEEGQDKSRSGFDYSLLAALILRGIEDISDLATILWNRPHSKAQEDGGIEYLEFTISKALTQFVRSQKRGGELNVSENSEASED